MVMLFKSDKPFVDLFAVMVRLFHRTWREMHASEEDINKVELFVHVNCFDFFKATIF